MSCGRHTTRRQAHTRRRAKTSHTVRKAAHTATRHSTTAPARKATSGHAAHKQTRRINKTRPKWSKTARPKKRTTRSKTATLKAHSTAHKHASRTARAHARATARAKARAAARAAVGRPQQKTVRQHAKTSRLYCRIASRNAVLAAKPISPRESYMRRLQGAYRSGSKSGVTSAYKSLRVAVPPKPMKPYRGIRAAKPTKG